MAALPIIRVPIASGIILEDIDTAAAALGDTAPTGPGRFLYVANGDASSHTVTITTPGTVSGLAIPDVAVVIAAGKSAVIPLAGVFRGPNGRANVSYDAVTSVTVAALEVEHG
ncbi:hypothetical protein [Streptomyces albipurpureus]|uniref:Uncharacterized protein n=1 Tax=Streptomyces albipurpureus TaxID=2897419 RepID=A0ABT0UP02_9ACTN|nr:hypothetical protein [Streptomyces sp. CWNU-1]MCM2390194.1 hypothetical protein [Streptomyces sp. CWNU-1]